MYKALTLPLIATLFFHGLIITVILIDAPKVKPMVKRAVTQYIKAELVTLAKPVPKKILKPKPKAKTKPKPKQKKSDDKAKQKAIIEKKAAIQKKARQQLKQQQVEKQLLEKQQEQQRLKEQAEKEFADAIEQENALLQVESDAELANSYIALITEVIQNNWSRPPSARNNMEAELALQLVPTGEVVSVSVVRSSGNSAFDRSAETAVLKAERFPELQQLPVRVFEQYFRRLRLKFRPEDLRL
jgi:TonB family protein